MNPETPTRIGLVDDHKLMRHGIAELIEDFEGFTICLEADHGKDLKKKLHFCKESELPHIILMDIEMKEMNGFETTKWLLGHLPDTHKELYKHKEIYKNIKVAALSMNEKDFSIIEMLKCGATGYIFKDAEPHELFDAIRDMRDKGYYYSQEANKVILSNLNTLTYHPNQQETQLLQWACTELTYKEIADRMNLSKRRVDGIREALFDKLNVKSRIGLVIYAIQRGIYKVGS
ncbi:response regulator transcription factor [Aureisphaera galaxeae]|uniref:response regulator n=1 Tax=Aureisphaera galaxeae TaxID=1538023 RepID=UPI002350A57A|nr:response regulator transcription factor [Aureisphaera galaxeae]MDC8006039.1 response regulator transcription factor [Aureisphaera galaxeae]